jgi:hypothetical protein
MSGPDAAPRSDAVGSGSPGGSGSATRSRPAIWAGLTGGLVGATCCIGPAVGVATGAGAGSFLVAIGAYRPHLFVVGGLVALAIAGVLLRRRRGSCATPAAYRALRSRWLDVALIAFAATYAFGRFVVAGIVERL